MPDYYVEAYDANHQRIPFSPNAPSGQGIIRRVGDPNRSEHVRRLHGESRPPYAHVAYWEVRDDKGAIHVVVRNIFRETAITQPAITFRPPSAPADTSSGQSASHQAPRPPAPKPATPTYPGSAELRLLASRLARSNLSESSIHMLASILEDAMPNDFHRLRFVLTIASMREVSIAGAIERDRLAQQRDATYDVAAHTEGRSETSNDQRKPGRPRKHYKGMTP